MKKLFVFILLFKVFVLLSFSASLTITSPKGGERWELGSVKLISWQGNALRNKVKITLWRNNVFVGVIVKNQKISGSYRWAVGEFQGGTASVGTGYKIKIREQGGANFTNQDESNKSFSIIKSNAKPEIRIISPVGREKLVLGSSFIIKWESKGLVNNVKITLWRNNKFIGLICKNQAKTGSYFWQVGSYLDGSASILNNYIINVREEGGINFKTYGKSLPFSIISSKQENSLIKPQIGSFNSIEVANKNTIGQGNLIVLDKSEPTISIIDIKPNSGVIKLGETLSFIINIDNANKAFLIRNYENDKITNLYLTGGKYNKRFYITPKDSGTIVIKAKNKIKSVNYKFNFTVKKTPLPKLPDLVVEEVEVSPRGVLKSIEPYRLAVRIANRGGMISRGKSVIIKITIGDKSFDKVLSDGLPKNTNTQFLFFKPYKLDKKTNPGSFDVIVSIDDKNYIKEANEFNNKKNLIVKYDAYPDLSPIKHFIYPNSHIPNKSYIILQFENKGVNIKPGVEVDVSFYINRKYYGKRIFKDGLKRGSLDRIAFEKVPNELINKKNTKLLFIIDPHKKIKEFDESNNRLEVKIK